MSIIDSLFSNVNYEDMATQQRIDDNDRNAMFNKYISEELAKIILRLEIIEGKLKHETTRQETL